MAASSAATSPRGRCRSGRSATSSRASGTRYPPSSTRRPRHRGEGLGCSWNYLSRRLGTLPA
eukprot:1600461-Alexandrium_andersonii.AAC.1